MHCSAKGLAFHNEKIDAIRMVFRWCKKLPANYLATTIKRHLRERTLGLLPAPV